MRDRIKSAAEASGRSMNAEIVERLEWSLASWPHIALPKEIVERAFLADGERRAAFELNLSGFAAQLADQHFPKTGDKQALIEDVWSDIINDMDQILEPEKKRLTEDMKTVVRELIKRGAIAP